MLNAYPGLNRSEFNTFADTKVIVESHKRSNAAGVSREIAKLNQELRGADLTKFNSRHGALSAYSRRLFSEIYSDLPDRDYLFILTDDAARLIALYSCPEILDNAREKIGLLPGVFLSEESCGTNAVALALRFREHTVTRGTQHYSPMFHRWCTVAGPVMDATRQPIACVAIVNCHDKTLAEKMALLKFIVKDIEGFHRLTVNDPEANNRRDASLTGKPHMTELTSRQHQVLTLFANGLSYKQIARDLGIGSTKTVEEHLDAVRGKLHVSNRRECIQKAISLGLLQI